MAAAATTSIRFGPLVTPVMFRSPVHVGRMAAQLDLLSSGRFVLGLGVGWNEGEHRAFGIAFPSAAERFERLLEAITVCRALWDEEPATFDGRYYSLSDAVSRPTPSCGRIPILIGGVGERRALRAVATYADEWCSEFLPVAEYRRKVEVLERHCEAVGRDPESIRRSMVVVGGMVPTARRIARGAVGRALGVGRVRPRADQLFDVPRRAGGFVVGGAQQIVDRLGEYAGLGLQEAVFKLDDPGSDEVPEFLAAQIAPAVRGL